MTLAELIEKDLRAIDELWDYRVYGPMSLDDTAELRVVMWQTTPGGRRGRRHEVIIPITRQEKEIA